jgi:hypothetical protein
MRGWRWIMSLLLLFGGLPGPIFPAVPLDLHVELYLGGAWQDVTADVRGEPQIIIGRGRRSDVDRAVTTSCALTLDNLSGDYNARNPLGAWYGRLGRNTQMRVRVGPDVRCVTEVPAWPPRADTTSANRFVPITGAGVFRRLSQGTKPECSTLYRTITADSPSGYWPADDVDGSTEARSAVSGVRTLPATGGVLGTPGGPPGAGTDTRCCEIVTATALAGGLSAALVTTGTAWTVEGWVNITQTAVAPTAAPWLTWGTEGTYTRWQLSFDTAMDGRHGVIVDYEGPGGVPTGASGSYSTTYDLLTGDWHYVRVTADQAGGNVQVTVSLDGALVATQNSAGTWGRITSLATGPGPISWGPLMVNVTTARVGHLAVFAGTTAPNHYLAGIGYVGETSGRRIERLCGENGIAFASLGDLDATEAMGMQAAGRIADLLWQCADADGGILFETRTALGLTYRTREDLYNQPPALTLDHSARYLSGDLEPTPDDYDVANDVTVSRVGGTSARYVVESGPLSVLDPPDGVGVYDTSVSMSVESDLQCLPIAQWRAGLGTYDGDRYPKIGVNLACGPFVLAPLLRAVVAAVDAGDRIWVTNPPTWLTFDTIDLLAQGYRETLSRFTWAFVWNTSPAAPWDVFVRGDDLGRRAAEHSTLAVGVDSAAVALSVATASGALWTTDAGDFPVDINVGGERMTVTDIAGAASPQAFTVTRSVNGVVKAHLAGALVELWHPGVRALGGS